MQATVWTVILVLYDGVCGLCNRSVRFLLDRDRRDVFRFAALQGALAKQTLAKYGANAEDLDTVYVVVDYGLPGERILSRARAWLYCLRLLGAPWSWIAAWYGWLPDFVLNIAYDLVARGRYRIFGKYDTCPLPSPGEAAKFLDGSGAPAA